MADERKRSPKVLIADDDPGIVRFLATRCAKMGFEVQTAANGLQALIMAGRNQPDVLIIDVNMPEVDGMSVSARLLRPDKWPLEVIVITASSYLETAGRCESFGAFHVRKGLGFWDGVRAALFEIFPDLAGGIVEEGPFSPPRAGLWERPRILVVDDDPGVGAFLSSRLSKYGVDTVLAHDGVQGYRCACREEPSIIIAHYETPNGDAHYLLQKLRSTAATESIPVVITSADRLDDATEARLKRDLSGRQGSVHFFSFPLDTKELFAVLQKHCAFAVNPNPREDHLYAPRY